MYPRRAVGSMQMPRPSCFMGALRPFRHKNPSGFGVRELRFHFGPGYRVYFTLRGNVLVFILGGGTKSTQKKDIAKAKTIAQTIEV